MKQRVKPYSEKTAISQEEKTCFWKSGMSTVEIVLIIVVLIALVLIFKNQITALVNAIFVSINNNAASIY